MSDAQKEMKPVTGYDASGQTVDLAEFEESFYKPGQVQEILKAYDKSLEGIEEGQVVRGKILRITDKEVIVDVNFKSEGIIPISEFKNVHEFKPGDEIDVFLEQVEDSEGQIILSKSRADFLKVWDRIYKAYEDQETVEEDLSVELKVVWWLIFLVWMLFFQALRSICARFRIWMPLSVNPSSSGLLK